MQQATTRTCPECGAAVSSVDLAKHLRVAHRLYEFRGVRSPLDVTVRRLVEAVCRPAPDPDAYRLLERLARQEYKRDAPAFLAAELGAALATLDASLLPGVCVALAALASSGRSLTRALTAHLAAAAAPAARQLALALTARLPPPLEAELVRLARGLLGDATLPEPLQLAAAAALLRAADGDGSTAQAVVKSVVGVRSRGAALERLRRLEALADGVPALTAFRARLEGDPSPACPRCQVRLRRSEMVDHLWREHRLVWHGGAAREPWRLVEEWLEVAVRHNDSAYLERCRDFARRLDPAAGERRFQRLALARGLDDGDARRAFLADAADRGASLCPYCFEPTPVPRDEPTRPMSVHGGRLSSFGYRVEVSDGGLLPRVEIEVPGEPPERSRPPAPRWTAHGAALFLAGPPTGLAFAFAVVPLGLPPLPFVAGLLLFAGVLFAAATLIWQPRTPAADRAIDAAWADLAPRLHADGFAAADAAFAASLALASVGRGNPDRRREPLARLLSLGGRLVGAGFGGARQLAALRRLALADAALAGRDAVLLAVAEVDACFHGDRPLAYADALLEDPWADGWAAADMARLRVLALESAFEAGFEVENLREAAETAPALGAVLRVGDEDDLARLRLLWSLRASRPWDREGKADTAFELAADPPSADLLERYPDLLLRHKLPSRFAEEDGGPAELLVTGKGVVFRGVLFSRPPRGLEVIEKRSGYDLMAEGHRFRFLADPETVAARLERWCRWLTGDFAPRVAEARGWKSPDATAVLRAWGAVRCPDCRRRLLPRLGEVGVPLESV